MDANLTTYSYVAVTNGVISELGSGTAPANAIQIPTGAAIYPGFIDSHSHAISFLVPTINGPDGSPFWLNLANVNVMLQPPCPAQPSCFTPTTTQDQVINALKSAKPNAMGWVLGWNYEPSRLSCNSNKTYGFLCPNNFENENQQTALQQMDAIRTDVPMMVTSESGHIVYVNTKGLAALNLCPPGSDTTKCYAPVFNPGVEWKLAQRGQLDEDLAVYAVSYIIAHMNEVMKTQNDPLPVFRQLITSSTQKYSQLGYTTVQEGAANPDVIAAYIAVARASPLPVRMAFLDYIQLPIGDAAYPKHIAIAAALRDTLASSDMFLAGIKLFADGTNQGYTSDMTSPVQYTNLNKPFTDPTIFPRQPYNGLADLDVNGLSQVVQWSHAKHLPVFIHTNGNKAQGNTLAALTGNPAAGIRDVIVHFTMPTQEQIQSVAQAGTIGVTFLMNDFYYYYQPLCEQLLQASGTANLYPAAWAAASGLHLGLHSDTSVTPPSPLFSVWVASTRSVQAPSWMPSLLPQCQTNRTNQLISRLQAIKAYTSDAAWLYNRDAARPGITPIGSLQKQYAGDLVVFSADPLDPATDLSTVKVLYTVHNGKVVYSDPTGSNPVVWPN
ncbi:amidohydrolase [Hyalangium versicolor]|uniref:amidohydrolase n=1 Tax=Hyalangium versicolor TaxID=2861190 RepID=UPI001CC986D8|nr:amidohydrolase family protein [Hyalangium versicolor]